jgi:hypothetical protein
VRSGKRISDLDPCIADGAEPLVAVLFETTPQQPPNRRRSIGWQCRKVGIARQY